MTNYILLVYDLCFKTLEKGLQKLTKGVIHWARLENKKLTSDSGYVLSYMNFSRATIIFSGHCLYSKLLHELSRTLTVSRRFRIQAQKGRIYPRPRDTPKNVTVLLGLRKVFTLLQNKVALTLSRLVNK